LRQPDGLCRASEVPVAIEREQVAQLTQVEPHA
jgi:hypothetical protein